MKTLVITSTLLILGSMLFSASRVGVAEASGTIYIKADGSIDPSTAPILNVNNITYTFTDNINESIVIQRSNIIIDGNYCMLRGYGGGWGMTLSTTSKVTVQKMEIIGFDIGIYLNATSDSVISANNITHCYSGVYVYSSSNNVISANRISGNDGDGIKLWGSSNNNTITMNTLAYNDKGVLLRTSSNNQIIGNVIASNHMYGVYLSDSSGNAILENKITNSSTGISIEVDSSNNNVTINGIADNDQYGIYLSDSSHNWIHRNDMRRSNIGLLLMSSSYNDIEGNNITNNNRGVVLDESFGNKFYHNNFMSNTQQVYDVAWDLSSHYLSTNTWDDGYPSGGNYWGGFGVDKNGDGIDDSPSHIDGRNIDYYPLMNPSYSSENLLRSPDITPPLISVISPEDITYKVTDVELILFFNERTSWVCYNLDGQDNVTTSGNETLHELSSGPHSVIVYAADVVGNVGASEMVNFVVEPKQGLQPEFPTWIAAVAIAAIGAGLAIFVYLVKFRKKGNHENRSLKTLMFPRFKCV